MVNFVVGLFFYLISSGNGKRNTSVEGDIVGCVLCVRPCVCARGRACVYVYVCDVQCPVIESFSESELRSFHWNESFM